MARYQYLFGPVMSRRMGRSLGVDLTPFKTCTENCLFCQLGPTPATTIARREYVPLAAVLAELDDWLDQGGHADYITLSGQGEPTLHTRFGEVLDHVRRRRAGSSALLTNGTLLHDPAVCAAAARADMVKTTLSAWDEESFRRLHRPHPGVTFAQLLAGARQFRAAYHGQLWLEVMLLAGINSRPEDIRRIAALAAEIAPDRIHLNTATRPPADATARGLAPDELLALADLFTPRAEVTAAAGPAAAATHGVPADQVLDLIRRHPCTAQDIALAAQVSLFEANTLLTGLCHSGLAASQEVHGTIYFAPAPNGPKPSPTPGPSHDDPR